MTMLIGRLPVRAPFPWPHLLEYIAHRLTPQFERIESDSYLRTLGKQTITVSFDAKAAEVVVDASGRVKAAQALGNVSRLLNVEHDAQHVHEHLRRSPVLEPRISKVPGMRPLGAWSPFELCVRTILGQQVTVAAARTLMQRFVQRCGSITPECIVAADLTNMGMPGKRVDAIRSFARAVLEQRVDFDQPWAQLEAALKALPGFGPWTRAYLAIRLGRDTDAFPETDVGLIRAANVGSASELLKLAESWRPYRAYAAIYLWAVAP
jgi:DNA-3-methyladenine glycosylase II